jgi:hypothetical protein
MGKLRIRRSTLALIVAFVGVFALWLAVRPAPRPKAVYVPLAPQAVTSPTAAPRPAPTTTSTTRPSASSTTTTTTNPGATSSTSSSSTTTSSPQSSTTSSTATSSTTTTLPGPPRT